MSTTYSISMEGLDAEQLGDVLAAINEHNRKYGAKRLPGPEVRAKIPDHFDVVLAAVGADKIQVIKAIREITGLGLKEAKDLVETAPQTVFRQAPRAEAERWLTMLRSAGASAEVR